VVSFVDPDDRELQYVFILFAVAIGMDQRVTLDDEYDHYIWRKLSEIQQDVVTNSTSILLNLGAHQNKRPDLVLDNNKSVENLAALVIHSDGGSRGNPGPSAAAFIIMDKDENIVAQGGKFLGRGDSGMAEYVAVELALEKATELGAQVVELYSDSLMVVNQLNGLFSVKNSDFRDVHDRIMKILVQFRRITFRHIHREYNRMADGLVNKILDQNEKYPAKTTSRNLI
jgi:ribonuclease HI